MVDLRKDKRAPASLKVKYKSVTVDQFIDQFGTDVSRGGIFVKTKKPIEIGALLKLELQLNDASPVIHGIGRVCWRREPGLDPNASAPAGMGIKFIKLDPESRTIVERIVNHRGDRPSRFEQTEGAEIAPPSISPPPASGAPPPITVPPPSPVAVASPVRAAAPIATKPASPALQPPPAAIANKNPTRAAVPTTPSVPTPAIAAPRAPAASKPFAPAPAPAPAAKAEPSKPVTAGSRAVAGLFADSPLSRTNSTESGAELRTRSSFFPPAPSNGSGSSSRPTSSRPTSGRSEQARQSGQFLATAFAEGGLAADTTEQARAAAEAGTDELLDELFDEVLKTSEHPAPPPLASNSARPATASESLSPVGAARVSQPSPMRESVDDMFAELSEEEGLSASSPALQTRKPASAPHSFPSAPLSARTPASLSARTPASLSAHTPASLSAHTPAASASASGPERAAMPEPDFDDNERTTQRSSVDDLLDGLDEETAAPDEAANDEQFGAEDDGFGEADVFAGGARPAPESNAPSDPPVPRILSSAPAGPPELTNARGSSAMPFVIILLVLVAAGGGFYFYQANQAAQRQAAAPAPVEAAPSAAPVVIEPSAANPAQPEQAPTAAPTDPGAAPAAAAPAPSAHADAPSAPGRSIDVEVSSVPRDANITVDGKPVGNTPAHVALVVDKPTEVKVSTAGYAAMIRTVVPSANNEPLRFKLEPLPYTLIVRSTPPSAQLAVGEHVALAPAPLDLGHLDGGVQVSISKDGYQRMTRLVRLDEFSEQGGVMRAEIEVTLGALPGGDAQHARPRPRPRTAADAPPAPAPSEPETSAPAAPSDHAAAPEAAPAPAAKPAVAEPPPAAPAPAAE